MKKFDEEAWAKVLAHCEKILARTKLKRTPKIFPIQGKEVKDAKSQPQAAK